MSDFDDLLLLENPTFEDVNKNNPLHYAIRNQNTAMVKWLLEQGALVNAIDKYGDHPLHITSNDDIFELLIKHGADVNYTSKNGSVLAMMVACDRPLLLMKRIVELGCDTNTIDIDGNNVLHDAFEYTSTIEVVKWLIDIGVDVNKTNNKGETPMDLAPLEYIDLFLEVGANYNTKHLSKKSLVYIHDKLRQAYQQQKEQLLDLEMYKSFYELYQFAKHQ